MTCRTDSSAATTHKWHTGSIFPKAVQDANCNDNSAKDDTVMMAIQLYPIVEIDAVVSSSPSGPKLATRARNKLWETSQCNCADMVVKGIPYL